MIHVPWPEFYTYKLEFVEASYIATEPRALSGIWNEGSLTLTIPGVRCENPDDVRGYDIRTAVFTIDSGWDSAP